MPTMTHNTNRPFNAGESLRHFTFDPTTGYMAAVGPVEAQSGERAEDIARRVARDNLFYKNATHIVVLPEFNPECWGPSVFRIERPVTTDVVGGV